MNTYQIDEIDDLDLVDDEVEAIEAEDVTFAKRQEQYIFFEGPPPSAEARLKWLESTNVKSPWNGFIGNQKAVRKAIRVEFDAWGKRNHACNELSIAVIGRAGCGKTDYVRRHAKALGLPLAEFSPRAINSTHDIFTEVKRICEIAQPPIYLVEINQPDHYILPPCVIFIDEVHALRPNIVQGLLKATEHNDRLLVTEKGVTVNCRNVHWIIATTDRGKLFDAFDTRFSKVNLTLYSKPEIAAIIQTVYKDWPSEACEQVAHFCSRVPRESLAFAREMQMEYNMSPGDWKTIAARVAEDNEIDPFGMTYTRLKLLKSLGQGPIAAKRLPTVAGVKEEELEKFILPWLMEPTEDQEPFIQVSRRGYTITKAGLAELDKRNIAHKGEIVLAA